MMIGGWWFALEVAKEEAKKLNGGDTGTGAAYQGVRKVSLSPARGLITENTTDEIHAAVTTAHRDRHVSV